MKAKVGGVTAQCLSSPECGDRLLFGLLGCDQVALGEKGAQNSALEPWWGLYPSASILPSHFTSGPQIQPLAMTMVSPMLQVPMEIQLGQQSQSVLLTPDLLNKDPCACSLQVVPMWPTLHLPCVRGS